MTGWIKLRRDITNWRWYSEPYTAHLFIHLMITANTTTKEWQRHTIKRGQCLTSISNISHATGLSEKQIRTRLEKLCETGEITVQRRSNFSLITICNYDDYQDETGNEEQTKGEPWANPGRTLGKPRANPGQTLGEPWATTKNNKNKENKKNKDNKVIKPKNRDFYGTNTFNPDATIGTEDDRFSTI